MSRTMPETRPMRHYCGELIHVQIFQSHGETIPAFFTRFDRGGDSPISTCPKCGKILDLDYCGSPYRIEPMPYEIAERTAKQRHCSNCWQADWIIKTARNLEGEEIGHYLLCEHCLEETIGYVSYSFVLSQRAEDHIDYIQNRKTISEALGIPLPEPVKTEEENLKELGF